VAGVCEEALALWSGVAADEASEVAGAAAAVVALLSELLLEAELGVWQVSATDFTLLTL
jgi:hypothetical protein